MRGIVRILGSAYSVSSGRDMVGGGVVARP
jgi:hypothetical protein